MKRKIAFAEKVHIGRPNIADVDRVDNILKQVFARVVGMRRWGRAAAVEELQKIADDNNWHLLFEAAHVYGYSHNNRKLCNFGECEVVGFHSTKFFNTFEGGAIATK